MLGLIDGDLFSHNTSIVEVTGFEPVSSEDRYERFIQVYKKI